MNKAFLVRATHRALKSAIACWRTLISLGPGNPRAKCSGVFGSFLLAYDVPVLALSSPA